MSDDRIEATRERHKRIQIRGQTRMQGLPESAVERIDEDTIRDLGADIGYLLSVIDSRSQPVETRGSDKDGFERFSFTFSSPSLVDWLVDKGAPEGFSEFVLEKGMGERLDVHVQKPFTITLVFYVRAWAKREAEGKQDAEI